MRNLTSDEMLLAESRISRMSKRFMTSDQRIVFDRYREQYQQIRDRYKQDFDYRVKTDLALLLITSLVIAAGLFSAFVYVVYKVMWL